MEKDEKTGKTKIDAAFLREAMKAHEEAEKSGTLHLHLPPLLDAKSAEPPKEN